MQLSFSHIMKHWKRTPQNVKSPGARNVLLRFYPPQTGLGRNFFITLEPVSVEKLFYEQNI